MREHNLTVDATDNFSIIKWLTELINQKESPRYRLDPNVPAVHRYIIILFNCFFSTGSN